MKNKIEKVEVARSFSMKLNIGGYQSCDFFCSQKAECKPEDAAEVSEMLYNFCKAQVIKEVNATRKELQGQDQPFLPKAPREGPKYFWGNEEPPAWTKKSNKALCSWLYSQGYTNSFNEPIVEVHSSAAIAGAREEDDRTFSGGFFTE